jgi:hypothetical protein
MSETEKLLNKQLLDKVQKAGLGMTRAQQQQLQQQLGGSCVRQRQHPSNRSTVDSPWQPEGTSAL